MKRLCHTAQRTQLGKRRQLLQFIQVDQGAPLSYISYFEKQVAISIVYFI